VFAVLAAFILTGCGQYAAPYPPAIPPHRSELVGTWVHEDEDTSTGATLTLNDDGTLEVEGIPFEVLSRLETPDWRDSTDLRSDSGTWEYDESQTVFDRLTVAAQFDNYDEVTLDLGAEFLGGPAQLVFVIGDPDSANFYSLKRDI
jgi:hypothetical protein